jgi:CRP-like cAMP-binding protein
MPIWFKVVKESEDIARVCRLRHKVFVQQEHRFDSTTDYIVDLYDALEETINILAFDGEEPVGTIRAVMDNPVGLPALDHYDFGPYISKLDGPCSCFGWLCVLHEYRRHPSLLFGLFKMAVRELRKKDQRHIIATLHPPLMSLLKRSFNAVRVGEDFTSGELKVPMTPAYIDTDNFPPRTREAFHDPEKIISDDSDIRRIYREGEPIITKGELGDEAFLIIRGSVRSLPEDEDGNLMIPGPNNFDRLSSKDLLFHQGEVFGELALLDQKERTSTIVPYSKEVDVMVWSREEFLNQMADCKETGLNISKLLGKRLRNQIHPKVGISTDIPPLLARIIHDASNEGKSDMDLIWLARQCGVWPDLLTKQMLKWQRDDLISHTDGRIAVLNLEKLRKIAEKGEKFKRAGE